MYIHMYMGFEEHRLVVRLEVQVRVKLQPVELFCHLHVCGALHVDVPSISL